MKIGGLKKRAAARGALVQVTVELTYKCDLDCFICYNDRDRSGKLMRLADYEDIFDQVKRLGVFEVILSGGEPLLHPDFFEIGAALKDRRILTKLKTNGTCLNEKNIQRLRDEVDPWVVQISLHGSNARAHDKQTGVVGSFERLLGNIRLAKAAGLRLLLSGIITAWNESEVKEMYALAADLGVSMGLGISTVPRTNGDVTPQEIALSEMTMKRVGAVYHEYMSDNSPSYHERYGGGRDKEKVGGEVEEGYFCSAGSSAVSIDPFGNVSPCVVWARSLGNVRDASVYDILHGSVGDKVRKRVWGFKEKGTCPAQRGLLK